MMYKSHFQKIEPYEWFCGQESHVILIILWNVCLNKLHMQQNNSIE